MEEQKLIQLIKEAKTGSSDAIAQLVKSYHPIVKAMVKKQVGEHIDYKPIETHAFSDAIRHLNDLEDPLDFEPFIEGYVKQEALRYAKPADQIISEALKDLGDDQLKVPGFHPESQQAEVQEAPAVSEPVQAKAEEPLPEPRPIEEPKQEAPAPKARPLSTDDEEEEEEPKKHSLFHRHKKEDIDDDEDDEDEEDDEEEAPKKHHGLFHRHKDDDPDDDDDEDEDDDFDDDEDEEEGGGTSWPLVVLIILLAIVVLFLILFIFAPRVYNNIAEPMNRILPIDLPLSEEAPVKPEETAVPAVSEPAETAQPSETPAEPSDTAEAEDTASPEAEETATPTPEASQAATPQAGQADAQSQMGTLTVNVNGLNIRSTSSTAGAPVGTAVSGKTYNVYDKVQSGGYTWYLIGDNQWVADNGSWVTYNGN